MAEIWLSKQGAATLLQKQADFIRTQIIPRIPEDAKKRGRGRGAPWELKGSAVVRAYVEHVAETDTGDPEGYALSDSPALERQRIARARLLEYELAERRNELISVELLQRATEAAFLPLRRFAEEQIKEYGNGTADAWKDAVEEFAHEIEHVIGQPLNIDGAEPSTQAVGLADSATAGPFD